MTLSDKPAAAQASQPFSRFEFLLAGRYLRARRKDAFISVISGLTLAGVALTGEVNRQYHGWSSN